MTTRSAVVLCAVALLAVPLLGPAASAEADPVFPEGVWRATYVYFDRKDVDERGLVEYTGDGSVQLEGVIEGETINVFGEIQFEASSKGESALSTSERTYQGVWRVEGWGSTLHAFGDLSVTARETPKGATGQFDKDFAMDGHGVLTLKDASCMSLAVDFETEVIPLPGAITGPALIGWFAAFPDTLVGENDAVFGELTEVLQFLTRWVEDPDLGNPAAVATALQRMRELGVLALQLQRASADAGSCGPAGKYYKGGAAFQFIADLLGDLAFLFAFANADTPNQVTAEAMIEVYRFAAAAGSFISPDAQDIRTMNAYPLELETLLADAIVDGKANTIDEIWVAAVKFGWESLAEKAASAR